MRDDRNTRLRPAVKCLLEYRNKLFHLEKDYSRLDDVKVLFGAGISLLECFPSVTTAIHLDQLRNLKIQCEEHKEFKDKRMKALNWSYEAEGSSSSSNSNFLSSSAGGGGNGNHEMTLAELEVHAEALVRSLDVALSKPSAAHTKLIMRLNDTINHLIGLETEARNSSNFPEARRLNVLIEGFRSCTGIRSDNTRDCFEGGNERITSSMAQLGDACDNDFNSLNKFEGKLGNERRYEDAERVKKLKDELRRKTIMLKAMLVPITRLANFKP